MNETATCNAIDLMVVAREYAKLGSAVQDQIDRVIAEGPFQLDGLMDEGLLNPGAMRNARYFWRVYDKAVGEDEAMWPDIEEWLAEMDGSSAD